MPDFKLKIETSAESGQKFWADMGPFFGSREIAKELGGPLYDDEGIQWVIARARGKVIGWAAFRAREDGVGELEWSWVAPERRRKGVWRAMHRARIKALKDAGAVVIRTMVRDPEMVKALRKEGLKKVGSRGSWAKMEKSLG